MDTAVDNFVAKYNGVHVDEDGYYGAQCWDLVARYAREVVGCQTLPTGSGGAEGLYRLHPDPIPQYFNVVGNDTSNASQVPPKGAIIVFSAAFSPPWGHTGLCLGADASGVTLLEQNGNYPDGAAYIKKRPWYGISGWLVPKQFNGGEDMINDTDNEFWRWNKLFVQIRGREASREEFRNAAVGQTWLRAMEVLSDSSEADAATNAQAVGAVAVRDNWQGQIESLQAALAVSNKAVSDANAALTTARQQLQDIGVAPTPAQLDAVTKQLAAAEAKAATAQANYEKAHAALVSAQKQTAADTATGNAFLRWLGGILRAFKG
jgi:hypothetical protein